MQSLSKSHIPTDTHTYLQILTHTYRYSHILTDTYTYVQILTHTYRYSHIITDTRTYVQILTHTYRYLHILTDTYTYLQILAHTYRYSHILTHAYTYFLTNTYKCFYAVECGVNCGLDFHNQTLKDDTKNGSYNAHIFTEEAIRIINKKVLAPTNKIFA